MRIRQQDRVTYTKVLMVCGTYLKHPGHVDQGSARSGKSCRADPEHRRQP